jgi:dTDP-4-dehydrorhamnose reductase
MKSEKVLVLGATGFLGGYFQNALGNLGVSHASGLAHQYREDSYEYISANLRSEDDVEKLLDVVRVSKVINCVALSNIDDCENNPTTAKWLNSDLPRALSKKCKTKGVQFIHVSTDAVFSGLESFAQETSLPKPISIYGRTKLQGELAVIAENPDSIVCRVNFFGWNPRGKSLFNFFYSNLKANQKVTGFRDIFFTPMYAADTAGTILELSKRNQSGTFHIVGDERISKLQFGRLIAQEMKLDSSLIHEGSYEDSPFSRTRTPDLSLSNVKIKSIGIEIPSLANGIQKLVKEMERKNA